MKKAVAIALFMASWSNFTVAQITFKGCLGIVSNQDYTFTKTGTTSHAGITRNVYETSPSDFTQSCSAGNCELRIIWDNGQSRWEIQLDNDGPANSPDYTTAELYVNTAASYPNPPDLSLGTWESIGFCPDAVSTLSGDVQSSTTLPVELINFSAYVTENKHTLSWQTASEKDNEKFIVESSLDGKEFSEIGEVKGNGTTTELHHYSFSIAANLGLTTYYRLKQVDFDEQYSYSAIVSVRTQSTTYKTGEFYPNPTTGIVHLNYQSVINGAIIINVRNLAGQLVQTDNLAVSTGNNNLEINLSALIAGIYFIEVQNQSERAYHKVILE